MPVSSDIEGPIDLLEKDGDPRKTAYFSGLALHHSKAVSLWQEVGLMSKMALGDRDAEKDSRWGHSVRRVANDEYERRIHFAPEHMLTVMAAAQSLGELLLEKGHLDSENVYSVVEAAAVHDAGKEREYLSVTLALTASGEREMKIRLEEKDIEISEAELGAMWRINDPGVRAQKAYDLAGGWSEKKLREKGFSGESIALQKMVAHVSCPEIEVLLVSFDKLPQREKIKAIQKLVMHYIDDIVTNPNIIDAEITGVGTDRQNTLNRRCEQNRQDIRYREYDHAWKKDPRNKTGETAFDMQERVGRMVEEKLAKLLGIEDPLTLPAVINERIVKNIEDNWERLRRVER